MKMKKILIAVPVQKYLEVQTFKAIYDLEVPEGYDIDFQPFISEQVDQVRNNICEWVLNGYDYLFSVDSDIAFPKDTLKKLLAHDVDMVSGIYRQRKPEKQILEIYGRVDNGSMFNIDFKDLKNKTSIQEIVACGFGCVLVKKHVFQKINYPQFEYKMANVNDILVSEDVDFCMKATATGSKIYVDPTIICDHYGTTNFKVI
jgi:GT2 family glycosyltransferase